MVTAPDGVPTFVTGDRTRSLVRDGGVVNADERPHATNPLSPDGDTDVELITPFTANLVASERGDGPLDWLRPIVSGPVTVVDVHDAGHPSRCPPGDRCHDDAFPGHVHLTVVPLADG